MAFNSQAVAYCLITAECKVEDASCFAGELVVAWVSCCLLGPLEAAGAETAVHGKAVGVGRPGNTPHRLPACCGAGGASQGTVSM